MREIKFRAWLIQDKKMAEYLDDIVFNSDHQINSIIITDKYDGHGAQIKNDKAILMQYTGLKDKNGKEIYEGDIVILDGGGEILNFVVEYEDGCYGIRTNGKDFAELKYYIDMSFVDLEIIGNVHGNSELMEVEK